MKKAEGLDRVKRLLMWGCVAALVLSALPLYAIAPYNHPYYDDYGFSAPVRHAWQQTAAWARHSAPRGRRRAIPA